MRISSWLKPNSFSNVLSHEKTHTWYSCCCTYNKIFITAHTHSRVHMQRYTRQQPYEVINNKKKNKNKCQRIAVLGGINKPTMTFHIWQLNISLNCGIKWKYPKCYYDFIYSRHFLQNSHCFAVASGTSVKLMGDGGECEVCIIFTHYH